MQRKSLIPLGRVYLVDARVDHDGGLAFRSDTGKDALPSVADNSETIVAGYPTPRSVRDCQPIKSAHLLRTGIRHVEVQRLTVVRPDPIPRRTVRDPQHLPSPA